MSLGIDLYDWKLRCLFLCVCFRHVELLEKSLLTDERDSNLLYTLQWMDLSESTLVAMFPLSKFHHSESSSIFFLLSSSDAELLCTSLWMNLHRSTNVLESEAM